MILEIPEPTLVLLFMKERMDGLVFTHISLTAVKTIWIQIYLLIRLIRDSDELAISRQQSAFSKIGYQQISRQ